MFDVVTHKTSEWCSRFMPSFLLSLMLSMISTVSFFTFGDLGSPLFLMAQVLVFGWVGQSLGSLERRLRVPEA